MIFVLETSELTISCSNLTASWRRSATLKPTEMITLAGFHCFVCFMTRYLMTVFSFKNLRYVIKTIVSQKQYLRFLITPKPNVKISTPIIVININKPKRIQYKTTQMKQFY